MAKTKQKTCSVDGCGRPCAAKGRCQMHYKRVQRRSPMRAVARVFRTGDRSVPIVVRCPKKIARALFAYASRNGLSRSMAIQVLLEEALITGTVSVSP